MAVFKDRVVPIPKVKGITINRADGNRVLFIKEAPYDAKAGYARPKRTTIGYVTDNDVNLMHPTSGYQQIFPSEWEKIFGENVPAVFKYIGMYAMTESVNVFTGIKDLMDQCFGISVADAMMDYVMYSMLYETTVTEQLPARMNDQLLYSGTCQSDSFYSDMLKNRINYSQIHEFRKKWALQCKEDGVEEVWLCIYGSDDDCESTGVVFDEKDHAKSLRNRNIVSFAFAVTADGKPVTFDVYRGGLVDAKALKRIVSFLNAAGIRVKGVILAHGYCDAAAIRFLKTSQIAYAIMVKGSPKGYADFVVKSGNTIKLNANDLIRGTNLFGVQDKVQLFASYKNEDYLTLFYDYKNGGERITALLKKIYSEIDRCEKVLETGGTPVFAAQFQDVLKVSDNKATVEIVAENLQKLIDEKGLYSVVTSDKMTPYQVHCLYQCRNCSEKDYMIFRSHLGFGKVCVRINKSVWSKFTMGFIASCVRYELQDAAAQVNRTTLEVIQEMNRLYMTKVGESYVPVQEISGRQELILRSLNSSASILEEIVKDENDRLAGRKPAPRHRKTGPDHKKVVTTETKQQSQKSKSRKTTNKVPGNTSTKKRGVKPGTKRTQFNKDGTPRRKPGVPAGTKRGPINKDGSPRKKPGPKVEEATVTG